MQPIAILPDFAEEGWLSMDYCAEQLVAHWPGPRRIERTCPPYRRLAARLASHRRAINADRAWNRYRRYPQFAKSLLGRFAAFHVVDHSYAHLVHSLPSEHTGVYCHDVDAFRAALVSPHGRWTHWRNRLGRHLLTGLQRAAIVFVNSRQTERELLRDRLVEPSRIVHAPLGVAEEYQAIAPSGERPPDWLAPLADKAWILHVGSCIPRKRIDVLLDALTRARQTITNLLLVKIGGEFTADHRRQIDRLGLQNEIVHKHGLTRPELASVYRAAPLTVVPSEYEGFGLPALEALACGSRVLASDIPALREAGGEAARYAPIGDTYAFAAAIVDAFASPENWPARPARIQHAAGFSWANHARIVAAAYERLLSGSTPASAGGADIP